MVATSSHLEYYGIIHTLAAMGISMVMIHSTLCFIHLLPHLATHGLKSTYIPLARQKGVPSTHQGSYPYANPVCDRNRRGYHFSLSFHLHSYTFRRAFHFAQ